MPTTDMNGKEHSSYAAALAASRKILRANATSEAVRQAAARDSYQFGAVRGYKVRYRSPMDGTVEESLTIYPLKEEADNVLFSFGPRGVDVVPVRESARARAHSRRRPRTAEDEYLAEVKRFVRREGPDR